MRGIPLHHSAWQLAGCETACQRLATGAAGAAVATTTLPAACAAHCYVYNSAFDGLVKIARQEGLRVLWTGTGISLLMAVPSVGMYMGLCVVCKKHGCEGTAPHIHLTHFTPLAPPPPAPPHLQAYTSPSMIGCMHDGAQQPPKHCPPTPRLLQARLHAQ